MGALVAEQRRADALDLPSQGDGSKRYPDDLGARMERIWGSGTSSFIPQASTRELVKLHPGVVAAPGDRVHLRVTEGTFQPFLVATRDFLEPTDRFFIARFPPLLVVPT